MQSADPVNTTHEQDKPDANQGPRKVYTLISVCVLVCVAVAALHFNLFDSRSMRIVGSETPSTNVVAPAVYTMPSPVTNTITPLPKATEATTSPAKPKFSVTSREYLVGNILTGKVYLSSHPDTVVPIASISKLFTSLVARQFMTPTTTVTITQQALDVYDGKYGILPGEQFTVNELYYPLLLQSNDSVGEALALTYGGGSTTNAFVAKMNDYASEIGMSKTHFEDPTGLSENNVSTANDLFTLAQFLYEDQQSTHLFEPDFFAMTKLPSESVGTTSDHGSHTFVNINPFVGYPDFLGGKTGRTYEAGETLLTIFAYQDEPIVVITLHSDYGMRQYDTQALFAKAVRENF